MKNIGLLPSSNKGIVTQQKRDEKGNIVIHDRDFAGRNPKFDIQSAELIGQQITQRAPMCPLSVE
jgi:hypothetical protein